MKTEIHIETQTQRNTKETQIQIESHRDTQRDTGTDT